MKSILTILFIGQFFVSLISPTELKIKQHRLTSEQQKFIQSKQLRHQFDTGSTKFYDYIDTFYVADLTLGTPPQTFQVVLDLSYSLLWVIDDACLDPACFGIPNPDFHNYEKHQYHRESSLTFYDSKKKYKNDFSSGTLSLDTFSIGEISVTNQTFGTATEIEVSVGYFPIDGFFGMGLKSKYGEVPPIKSLFSQMDKSIFMVWLNRHIKPSEGLAEGLVTFGALDSKNCDSNLTYVPLLSDDDWYFNVDSFAINNYLRKRTQKATTSFADAFLVAPYIEFNAIIHQTGAVYDNDLQKYVLPCDSYESQPDLKFTIGGQEFVVPATNYIVDTELGDNKCSFGIYSSEDTEWLLADVFVRTVCTLYDYDNKQMGFAKAFHK